MSDGAFGLTLAHESSMPNVRAVARRCGSVVRWWSWSRLLPTAASPVTRPAPIAGTATTTASPAAGRRGVRGHRSRRRRHALAADGRQALLGEGGDREA